MNDTGAAAAIVWHPWGRKAFDLARTEDCPIFLLISSPSDPWCVKFDDEVLSEPRVSKLLEERFVLVRVDPARRPDVDLRYHQGGRPSVAVLTPAGGLFYGATYLDADELVRALEKTRESYRSRREDVEAAVLQWKEEVERRDALGGEREKPGRAFTREILDGVKANFDTEYGGFVESTKRPLPDSLELLLYAAKEWRDERAARMLEQTLKEMAASELWDAEHGGFFSACAGPGWTRPRRIKSLMGNARLLRIYLDAYALGGDAVLRETGRKAAAFLTDRLFDGAAGAFKNHDRDGAAFHAASNAAAAWALLRAAVVLETKTFRERALDALDYVKTDLAAPGGGIYHFKTHDGETPVAGQLLSHVWPMRAYLEAYQHLIDPAWRDEADRVAGHLFLNAWDREMGGFFDRWGDDVPLGDLVRDIRPVRENSFAFQSIWILRYVKGKNAYAQWMELGLSTLIPRARKRPHEAAPLAQVCDQFLAGRLEADLVGRVDDAETRAVLEAYLRHYQPRGVLAFIDPDDQDFILAHRMKAPSYPRLFFTIDGRVIPMGGSAEEVDRSLQGL